MDKESWNIAVQAYSEANFLSSWEYGQSQEAAGAEVLHYNSSSADIFQAVVRDARRGRYLEIGGGPLLDWSNPGPTVQAIKDLATDKDCVFVRVRPQLVKSDESMRLMAGLGFATAPMHLLAEHTSIIDLSPTVDDLLAAMRKKTRYEVRQAAKKSIYVSVDTSKEALVSFVDLMQETSQRQNFVLPPRDQLLVEILELSNLDTKLYHACLLYTSDAADE